jgi:cobyrinic acid a,c-diamide synthase
MGALYDGKNGTVSGSSAQIAKHLGLPVLLVVDIWGMTVTTGAVLKGLSDFDPQVKMAGILLNRAGSRGHFEMVMKSLKPAIRNKVIGYLPHSETFSVTERHLGLKTVEENGRARKMISALEKAAEGTIDRAKLIRLFESKKASPQKTGSAPVRHTVKVRIGIAKDPAFCFYYAENLRLLQDAGAKLVYFSPLKDRHLPPDLGGLYLGGGYPESFPKELSANRNLRVEVLQKVKEGMPVYAECGGLMYLSESLAGFDGKVFPMVSALPLQVKMEKNRLAIHYVELKTTQDSLLGPQGTLARGQEFHQSRIISNRFKGKPVYDCVTSTGRIYTEGFQSENLLASYIHLHFKSNPLIAESFVEKCRRFCR